MIIKDKLLLTMKKIVFFMIAVFALTACHHETLEERAARESKEYTMKNCPSAIKNNIRTDSLVFDKNTHAIIYYYTLFNEMDDSMMMANEKEKLLAALKNALTKDISLKTYKDAGFNIRYEYHSSTRPELILLEKTFTPEEYSN